LPAINIHRICGEIAPEVAAAEYERELVTFFSEQTGVPRFDLILLGMGDDGHVASLFPGSPALEEQRRLVISVKHNQPPLPLVDRVSVTFPLINAAKQVMLIVTGAAKAQRVEEAFSEVDKPQPLPVQRVKPVDGEVVWFLDEAVLKGIEKKS
jgi:6-phosphogluconolactonase